MMVAVRFSGMPRTHAAGSRLHRPAILPIGVRFHHGRLTGAAVLDPDDPSRLFDLGTVLGAAGQMLADPVAVDAHTVGTARTTFETKA